MATHQFIGCFLCLLVTANTATYLLMVRSHHNLSLRGATRPDVRINGQFLNLFWLNLFLEIYIICQLLNSGPEQSTRGPFRTRDVCNFFDTKLILQSCQTRTHADKIVNLQGIQVYNTGFISLCVLIS